jgi:hypothetical protein
MCAPQGVRFHNAAKEGRVPQPIDLWEDAVPWGRLIINALLAREFYLSGRQYIVRDTKVLLIDQSTGRVLPISRCGLEGRHRCCRAVLRAGGQAQVLQSSAAGGSWAAGVAHLVWCTAS